MTEKEQAAIYGTVGHEMLEEYLGELSVEAQHRPSPEVQKRVDEWVNGITSRVGVLDKTAEANSEPIEVETEPKVHHQYYEPAEGTGGLPAVICTCGRKKHHLRFKVLQRWSEKHFDKTGHNTNAKQ